ncbi:MAG: hypothetical protein Q4G05_01820 [Clostridia bacterium]|nr:hypothetical protein [Clostridia bacterium]
MTNEQLIKILVIVLGVLFFVLIVLLCSYIYLRVKNSKKEEKVKVRAGSSKKAQGEQMIARAYTKESIFNFMEFDKVEDNMIVQKNGSKFLMVLECQGVNYDLMSEIEKTSVEEGFQEFLNTLRNPIQIYTQTRSVNLESSLENYRERLKKVEDKLNKLKMEYENMRKAADQYTQDQLDAVFFEITKQTNLYEYGKDIIFNTEKMSLNKNVLNKQYYIVIPYYPAELGNHNFDNDEVKNIAFTELYTKAQSITRTLSACGVNSRILGSTQLVELLYMSYNRDDAEVYGMDKILKSNYEELYSTAPDLFDRKIKQLQKEIEEKAFNKANDIVDKVYSKKQLEYEEKEESLEDLVAQFAELILKESETNLGKELVEDSIKELKKQEEKRKGGNLNVQKEKTGRGRKPKQQ